MLICATCFRASMCDTGTLSAEHIVDEIRRAAEREENQKLLEARTASPAHVSTTSLGARIPYSIYVSVLAR